MDNNDNGDDILEYIANLPNLPVEITNSGDILSSNLPNSTVEASTPWRLRLPAVPTAVPPPLSSSSHLQRRRQELPAVPTAVPPPLSSSSHLQRRRQELPNSVETPSSVFLGQSVSLPPWSNPYNHTSGSFSRNRDGNGFPLDSFPRRPENNGSWSNPRDQNFRWGGGGRSSPSGHVAYSSSYPPTRASSQADPEPTMTRTRPPPGRDLGLGSHLRSVAEAQGRVADVARDMYNGRILGDKLAKSSPEEVASVAAEIVVNMQSLSVHRYGHYVVMKLVEVVDQRGLTYIFDRLLVDKKRLVTICANKYGSQVMTKFVERLMGDNSRHCALMESLCSSDSRVLSTLNSNSTHFLENCFVNFSYDALRPLIVDVSRNILELATNPRGYRVLCQCISMSFKHRADDTLFHTLIPVIIDSSYVLANDLNGNYVVRYVIEGLKETSFNSAIYNKLKEKLNEMSTIRESCHVVQKLLLFAENSVSEQIVEEIMKDPSRFLRICTDKYGSYVVEACIKQAKLKKLSVYRRLENLIKINENELRRNAYGLYVLKTMCKCENIFM